ncbi:dachshund homolog 1-like isoform X2 [Lineus longissimus]|uniref:dachshund homolog 1-like isoform X2 n=1 Tax=Lineus longissimus TaxID=88925 RepID=UPI00315DD970
MEVHAQPSSVGSSPPHPQLSPPIYREEQTQPLSLKMEKPISYGSPPPLVSANNPENNVCKMIEYRGAKVAAFHVEGRELICLPQAFDLFLKHLVGGLHTVYTKLKRLEITPVVCNVEQVRILRGLGAIQPGVNRCKLISCKEFDILYDDCTNSSARPGRPPKRSPAMHANTDTLEKLKKSRLDTDYIYGTNRIMGHQPSNFHQYGTHYDTVDKSPTLTNGYHHYPPHLSMLPFMPMSYPAMTSAASMVMSHNLVGLDATTIKERATGDEADSISPSSYHAPRYPEDVLRPRSGHERLDDDRRDHHPHNPHPLQHHIDEKSLHRHSTDKESGSAQESLMAHFTKFLYLLPGQPLGIGTPSDFSTNGPTDLVKRTQQHQTMDLAVEDDNASDDDDDDGDSDNNDYTSLPQHDTPDKMTSQKHYGQQLTSTDLTGPSSLEALLLNIQGLLKVAAEHAKQYERQIHFETAELKMEVLREREMRETIERRLLDEQRLRETFQKRWKKEKKARRKFQEQTMMEPGDQRCHLSSDEGNSRVMHSPSPMRMMNGVMNSVNGLSPVHGVNSVNGSSQSVIHAIKTNG